ncbi:hypothetical protein C2G38_2202931 [Gigaspora rosea]|uniref:Uncharacterized protein n=1 Tax=Gigaspora rosea TaxID=44941 RepID=A0A397US76_9GLOM|nr:hypothetical protein C2G38_2202931 [Gigaspora rosea]
MTKIYGKYGYKHDGSAATGYCILFGAFIYLSVYWQGCNDSEGCNVGYEYMLITPGAIFSIPLAYPYLNDQIIGPDYRIIQCNQIDSLGSWLDQWCAYHQRLLCKRGYKISKLWVVYQYQYRKGLFLTCYDTKKPWRSLLRDEKFGESFAELNESLEIKQSNAQASKNLSFDSSYKKSLADLNKSLEIEPSTVWTLSIWNNLLHDVEITCRFS